MNQMKREIFELIRRYVGLNKLPDRDYIMTLIEIIVKYRDLGDYIIPGRTKFLNKDGKTIADYSFDRSKRNINIYWVEVEKTLKMIKDAKDVSLTSLGKLYDALFQIAETIYHETEHADHVKQIELGPDSFEKRILDRSYDIGFTLPRERSFEEQCKMGVVELFLYRLKTEVGVAWINHLYDKYYIFAPEERLASIKALEVTLDILEAINAHKSDELSSLYNFRRCRLLFESLHAYDKQLSPTMFYFDKLGLLDEEMFELLSTATDELSMDERIKYGLAIPAEEFQRRWQEKEELKKSFTVM